MFIKWIISLSPVFNREEYNMITLREAFKLCDISDDELIYLRRSNQIFLFEYTHITGKRIREKYDMRKTMVKHITPYFSFGEYLGLLFTITE
jgi:hypothetical protein